MHHILTAKTFCETNTTLELKLHPTTYRKNISCIAYGTTQTIPMREHQLGESSRDWWRDNKKGTRVLGAYFGHSECRVDLSNSRSWSFFDKLICLSITEKASPFTAFAFESFKLSGITIIIT